MHYCPFMIDPPTPLETAGMPSFENRRDFFWIGNFRHAPNWDAVQWLKSDIWPSIRKRLPEASLHIVGSYANQAQLALHQPEQGFIVEGRVDSADARFLDARVCLAPLRFGAGLKGKLIDAMRNGTPSVTTAMGAEAIAGGLPWSGAIQESAAGIAQSAVRLYGSERDWQEAQSNGFQILDRRFNRREHERLLTEQIDLARQELGRRRMRNFTGAMLRDHHHRSTRYLSLWIEAKGRLADRADSTE
jgi:glycosyltransferase involved in cell wall biosynthesis